MPLRKTIAATLESVANNVSAFIVGPPADAEASCETTSPSHISHSSSTRAHPVAPDSPQSVATPMPSNVRAKLKIAYDFEGSDRHEPIAILDDEDKDVQILATRQKQAQAESPRSTRTTCNLITASSPRKYRAVSPDEDRLLGNPGYSKAPLQELYGFDPDRPTPKDAVPVQQTTQASDMGRKRQSFTARPLRGLGSGGVQPGINTMKPVTKSDLIRQQTTERRDAQHLARGARSMVESSPTQYYRQPDEPAPKKQKREAFSRPQQPSSSRSSSPVKHSEPLGRLQNGNMSPYFTKSTTPTQPASLNGTSRINPTPLRNLNSDSTIAVDDDDDVQMVNSSRHVARTDEQPDQFTRNAKQRRRTGSRSNPETAASPQRIPLSDVTGKHSRSVQDEPEDGISQTVRSTRRTSTPRQSKMDNRIYGGSPDELSHIVDDTTPPPARRRPPLSPTDHRKHNTRTFELKNFVIPRLLSAPAHLLEIDLDRKELSIHYQSQDLSKDPLVPDVPIQSINRIVIGTSGDSNIIGLGMSLRAPHQNQYYLEFASTKPLNDFLHLIHDYNSTMKIGQKPDEWLQQAMSLNHVKWQEDERRQKRSPSKDRNPPHSRPSTRHETALAPPHRKVDSLDKPESAERTPDQMNGESGMRASRVLNNPSTSSQHPKHLTSIGARQTRSTAMRTHHDAPRDDSLSLTIKPPRLQSTPWKKALIYPHSRPRPAQVSWEDLAGLEDGEYLNDSVVTFFIRYLQEHGNPEQVKQMHFFSTFFYETMTKSVAKGQQINYKSVEKWTKSVNIFNRDFVIVPVNESHHWFLLIICNLKRLYKSSKEHEQGQDTEPQSPSGQELEDETKSDEAEKNILTSDIVPSSQLSDDHDVSEVNGVEHKKRKPGRRKQTLRAQRKYDTTIPIIITLDSLDVARSGQASKVKDYLVQEAKEKLQLDFDKNDIAGMTAKDIPQQNNYVDCGLYLCVYLERFMQNPYEFVRAILQRKKEDLTWPQRLRSSTLRDRLYGLLQDLQSAQEEKKHFDDPPLGNILIKPGDYSMPEVRPKVDQSATMDKKTMAESLDYAVDYLNRPSPRIESVSEKVRQAIPGALKGSQNEDENADILTTKAQFLQQDRKPITIDDESQDLLQQEQKASKYFSKEDKVLPQLEDTPSQMAERIRKERSPLQHQTPPKTDPITIISTPTPTPTPLRKQNLPQLEPAPIDEFERSASVSTDFLTSNESYNTAPSPAPISNQRKTQPASATNQFEMPFEGFSDHDQNVDEDVHMYGTQASDGDTHVVIPESFHGNPNGDEEMQLNNDNDDMMLDH